MQVVVAVLTNWLVTEVVSPAIFVKVKLILDVSGVALDALLSSASVEELTCTLDLTYITVVVEFPKLVVVLDGTILVTYMLSAGVVT